MKNTQNVEVDQIVDCYAPQAEYNTRPELKLPVVIGNFQHDTAQRAYEAGKAFGKGNNEFALELLREANVDSQVADALQGVEDWHQSNIAIG